DLEQPRGLELGGGPTLEPAERVQEGGLRRVLGLLAVAELVLAERQDLPVVSFVEQACGFSDRLLEPGRDGCRMAFGRYCGHVPPVVNPVLAPSARRRLRRNS